MGAGGHVLRREPFEPLLAKNTSHVSPCYAYRGKRDGESDADYVARLAAELDTEFQRVGPDNVCAFIAETVVGAVWLYQYRLEMGASANSNIVTWLRPSRTRLLPRHESCLREVRCASHL